MAKVCPDCAYYNGGDATCRHDTPVVTELSGQNPVTFWPNVGLTDWCAQGWNQTDGYYEPAPNRTT